MKTEVNASSSDTVKPDSLQAWLLAVRPRTLSASAAPVIVACALSFHFGSFRLLPAVLCLVFALLAQVASNFANDYFDFYAGSDSSSSRVGPARAVSSGWISPSLMRRAVVFVVSLACFFGLGLVFYGGWSMLLVGLACVFALFAYSAGPFPASRYGFGDLFVAVFYGFVPVLFTFFLVSGLPVFLSRSLLVPALLASLVVALPSVNILVLNNYRDYQSDRLESKLTTVVIFGRRFAEMYYLICGLLAVLSAVILLSLTFPVGSFSSSLYRFFILFPLLYLPFHVSTWRGMCRVGQGAALNRYLGLTSRNLLLISLLLSFMLIIFAM